MGPHKKGKLDDVVNPATGQPVTGIVELSYDWPQLSKDEVFELVQLKIRAGTTGVPDDLDRQESWTKLLPVIQPLISQIMQFQLQGINPAALISLLKETVMRFDDKLDLEAFVPQLEAKPETSGAKPDTPEIRKALASEGQALSGSPQGNNLPPASGDALLAGSSGSDDVFQGEKGMNEAQADMPGSQAEPQPEEKS